MALDILVVVVPIVTAIVGAIAGWSAKTWLALRQDRRENVNMLAAIAEKFPEQKPAVLGQMLIEAGVTGATVPKTVVTDMQQRLAEATTLARESLDLAKDGRDLVRHARAHIRKYEIACLGSVIGVEGAYRELEKLANATKSDIDALARICAEAYETDTATFLNWAMHVVDDARTGRIADRDWFKKHGWFGVIPFVLFTQALTERLRHTHALGRGIMYASLTARFAEADIQSEQELPTVFAEIISAWPTGLQLSPAEAEALARDALHEADIT